VSQPILTEVLKSPLSDLPEIVVEVLDVCARPDASVADVADAIEKAPGIALRLLRFANSAELGRTAGPTTLLDATAIAGLDLCRTMALGEVIASRVSSHNQVTLAVRSHCLLTAAAARSLTRAEGRRAADEALLAGLLALVGELAAAECRPSLIAHLLRRRLSFHPDTERAVMGVSGPELSGHLLRRWRIPGTIVAAVEGRDEHAELVPPLANTLRRAVGVAELLSGGHTPTADELDALGLDSREYTSLLIDLAELAPTLAPITGESEQRLVRMVSTTRASIVAQALSLERDVPWHDIDHVTGLPSRRATQNYAEALDDFAARARIKNPETPAVGALLFTLMDAPEVAEQHGPDAVDGARAALVSQLQAAVRSNEFLGTVSDNALVIIAPATSRTDLDGAVARFDRVCAGLTADVLAGTMPVRVSVSSILNDIAASIRSLAGLATN